MKDRKVYRFLIISLISAIFVFLVIKIFLTNKLTSDKKYCSVFYQKMFNVDEFDFIKTGEFELENINNYLEANKDNPSFNLFISTEKNCLINEIEEKKLYIYTKKDGIKDTPDDYETYQRLYPEQVEKFKGKGKVLEYDKIDYIELYKACRKVSIEEEAKLVYPDS